MNLLKLINILRSKIKSAVEETKKELYKEFEIPNIIIELPAQKVHGDLSTNIAMISSKKFGIPPRDLASLLINKLNGLEYISKTEIAGPGFINFFVNDLYFLEILKEIENESFQFGKLKENSGKKVLVEFVSSNPTGPMHIGNARLGALGDTLSSILEYSGFEVCKEFYVNDAGNQIKKFAESLAARYIQIFYPDEEFPEDGYHGDDIKELAKQFMEIHGNKFLKKRKELLDEILNYALPLNINRMKSNLSDYKVNYDNWFYESSLYQSGEIDSTIEFLKNHNATYYLDKTLWFKASEYGAEKDEVLVRKNGIPTYFAADIAYHVNKFLTRKFDTCIDFLGADHHGHISRMHAAMQCFGIDKSRLIFIIVQMVRIIKDGQVASMSKRSGHSESLEDFIKMINVDCARFMFTMFDSNSTMDFDIDLAVKNDSSNPSYYVKYAYARIQSILKLFEFIPKLNEINIDLLKTDVEKELIFTLSMFPYEINESSISMNPSRIARYALKLASLFHKFYNENKINSEDKKLTNARVFLSSKVAIVLQITLSVLRINAPDMM